MPKAFHLSPGRIAVLVTVCAVVVGIALTGGGMFSPGNLNAQPRGGAQLGGVRSHAELGGKCSACHVPPWSSETMADRCMACHTDVRGQIDGHQPLHGRLANNTQCRNCHTEHKGGHAALTDLSTFDHDCAAFALTGKHASADCKSCHTSSTYKGTTATCVGCHAEPKSHMGQFGADCAKCHATNNWRTASFLVAAGSTGSTFDHSRTAFPLTGHHTAVDCKKCHTNNTFKGTPTSCVSCHAEPKTHLGKFGTDCKKCHATETWKLASIPTAGPGAAFDHNLTAFKLTGKHTTVTCAQCHKDNKFKGTAMTCVSCHAEPKVHAGSKFGIDCQKCHTTNTWTGGTLSDFKHAFPINHGRKKNVAANGCKTCHAKADAYATYTCYGCHEHTPANMARKHKNVANLDNCVKCHKGGRGRERAALEFGGDEFVASRLTDNRNTYCMGSLCEAYELTEARRLVEPMEWHYRPQHGSGQNMEEIELTAAARPWMDRRLPDTESWKREVATWEQRRNDVAVTADWQFSTAEERVKLKKRYPVFQVRLNTGFVKPRIRFEEVGDDLVLVDEFGFEEIGLPSQGRR